jgi:excisionase family DNA binding protein
MQRMIHLKRKGYKKRVATRIGRQSPFFVIQEYQKMKTRVDPLQKNPAMNTTEDVAIQAVAHRMGTQISHVVCAALIEMLVLLREQQQKTVVTHTVSSPSPTLLQYESLLTANEVARILKISRAKAYQIIKRKEIRSFSIDKTIRVRREDLETFITEHLVS